MVIKGKVERAFKAVIEGLAEYQAHIANANEHLPVLMGAETGEQERPCVVVHCFNTTEEPQPSGNYFADVRILVKSESDQQEPFDDRTGQHNARCEAVLGGIKRDDLEELLSAAVEDFYVYRDQGVEDLGADPQVEGRSFVDGHVFRIYCCGMDLE